MDAHSGHGTDVEAPREHHGEQAGGFLRELSTLVLGSQPLNLILTRIAVLAAEHVPGTREVSVTLIEGEKPRTMAFSGQLAAGLDERQYQDFRGPCLHAAASGTVVAIEDTGTDTTYPEFCRQAVRAGVGHVYCVPLWSAVAGHLGALNFYGSGEPMDAPARVLADQVGAYAAVALTNASLYTGAVAEAEHLRAARAARAVIEQAKGIIMAGRGCTAEEAFEVLRTESAHTNRKLRDIAQDLVTSVLRPR